MSGAGEIRIPSYTVTSTSMPGAEIERCRQFLVANGTPISDAGLRAAAQDERGAIREAAFTLLMRDPSPAVVELLRRGTADADQSVRAVAAFGLYRLGDARALVVVQEIAARDPHAGVAALRAAGFLAEAGSPDWFGVIAAAAEDEAEYIRLIAVDNAWAFEALHGRPFGENGAEIDMWGF